MSPASILRGAVIDTFTVRNTPLPAAAPPIPEEWHVVLASLLDVFILTAIGDVEALERGWVNLWQPILDGTAADRTTWSTETRSWAAI